MVVLAGGFVFGEVPKHWDYISGSVDSHAESFIFPPCPTLC